MMDVLTVKDWMNREVVTIAPRDSIYKAASIVAYYEQDYAVVTDSDKKVAGVASFAAIMEALLKGGDKQEKIETVISRQFPVCHQDDSIHELVFPDRGPLLVVDREGRLQGSIAPIDITRKSIERIDYTQSLEQMIEWFTFCFDTAYEGITVVDRDGFIRLFNESYTRYVGVSQEEAVGKHCTEVIENTRLPVVLETGLPERNQPHTLQGVPMIVHRLPIWRGDELIGAVGMLIFEGVSELYDTYNRMQNFQPVAKQSRVFFDTPKLRRESMVTFDHIIGSSTQISQAKKQAIRAAKTAASILITGESGVGKEMFVRAIHQVSPMNKGPLISLNCAAIPEDLLESELFGYDAGAFTGARQGGKPGKFELAHEGTLLLDEIGDMSPHLQAKLLRVLQDQTFERVGGTKEVNVNVRIIAATNQPLADMIETGEFRADLYYRLNILPINIPPLRERKTDIPLLVSHLIRHAAEKHNLAVVEVDQQAVIAFMRYHWPGNVREMANLLERLVIMTDHKRIEFVDLPDYIKECYEEAGPAPEKTASTPQEAAEVEEAVSQPLLKQMKETDKERERELLLSSLQQADGNKTKAAALLGIHRSTFYKKIKKLFPEEKL
ncbi:sigma-54-dependent Fis family transcriptional regulator [Bacillus piscicola]|uniref:sigma-54-dependent Fis family transcriptional regulator n=1 Tax=Bacillus piscicola TaxID=1632684 RepID=UPI001F097804|nr:sigma-54-dependent Fis family transcriptional regulator [Bacillus piscicola]